MVSVPGVNFYMSKFTSQEIMKIFESKSPITILHVVMLYFVLYYNEQNFRHRLEEKGKGIHVADKGN